MIHQANRRLPKLGITIAIMALVLGAGVFTRTTIETTNQTILADESGLKWFRGNMHTHSHWSDGDDYLESIGLWYRNHEYDFLVFTDHNILADAEKWVEIDKTKGGRKAFEKLKLNYPDWVEERTKDGKQEVRLRTFPEVQKKLAQPGKFLLIQGEEISDRFEGRPLHMNASNLLQKITPVGGVSMSEAIQNNFNEVEKQSLLLKQPILAHLNHPNFHYAITAEDMLPIRGEKFFEVYNGIGDCFSGGDELHASTERIWDILLSFRLTDLKLPLMYGLATDDSHNYHENQNIKLAQPGRGWVMVLAENLEPESLIHAMEKGRFYASTGVRLKRIVSDKSGLDVEIDPEEGVDYQIEFIGTKSDFPRISEPVLDQDGKPVLTTRKYSPEIGKVLATHPGTSAKYEFQPDDVYVRATIKSTRLKDNASLDGEKERAWVQPTLGPAATISE